jgi:hypothetical protein
LIIIIKIIKILKIIKKKTIQEYLDIILDCKNFDKIEEFDKIKKKIFKYVEKIENGITTSSTIKRVIQKENKKRLNNNIELIDTKEKYDEYAKEWGLSLSSDITIKNNNWVKLLRPDFDDFIKHFYTWDELKNQCNIKKISSYYQLIKIIDNKIPINYLNSGIYNINKIVNYINIYITDDIII